MKPASKIRLSISGIFFALALLGYWTVDQKETKQSGSSSDMGCVTIGAVPALFLLATELFYRGRAHATARAAARGEKPWEGGPLMYPAAIGLLLLAALNLLTPGGVTPVLLVGEVLILLGAAAAIYLGLRPPEECASAWCKHAPLFFRRRRGWRYLPNRVVCPTHWPSYRERMTCAGCGSIAPELLLVPGRFIAGYAGFGRCWECRKSWCSVCDRKRDEGDVIYHLCPTCGGELSNDLLTDPSIRRDMAERQSSR